MDDVEQTTETSAKASYLDRSANQIPMLLAQLASSVEDSGSDVGMTIRVPWSLCHLARDIGKDAVRCLRLYMVMAMYSPRGAFQASDVQKAYKQLSLPKSEASEDFKRALMEWKLPGGKSFQLMTLSEKGTHHRRNNLGKVVYRAGLEKNNFCLFELHAVRSLVSMKRELYRHVLFTFNQDDQTGVTISREGIEKLTGASKKTQKRYEAELGVVARRNVVELAGTSVAGALIPARPASPEYQTYVRSLGARRIANSNELWMRNSYFLPMRNAPKQWADAWQARGNNVKDVKKIFPQFGDKIIRQTYKALPARNVIRDTHYRGVDIDVYQGERVIEATGEIVGWFARHLVSFKPLTPKSNTPLLDDKDSIPFV